MNQGKLEVIKQEMARLNVEILGMDEFNSDDYCIYYCGQESLRRNGVTIIVNKRIQCSTWTQSQNRQNDLCSFQGKPFNIAVIQSYAPTTNAKEAEVERFYEDLQDLLELIPKNDVRFTIGDWNAKVGSQEILGVTGNFGLGIQNDSGQRLTEAPHLNIQIEIHLQRLFYCIR